MPLTLELWLHSSRYVGAIIAGRPRTLRPFVARTQTRGRRELIAGCFFELLARTWSIKGGLVGKYSHDQTSDTVLCSGVQRKIELYNAVELFWYKLNAAYIYTYICTPIHLVILHFYYRTNTIKIYGYNRMWLYQHTLVLWLKWSTNTRTNQLITPWFHFPGDHFTWFLNIPRSWKPMVSSTWNRPREVLVSHVSPWNVMFNGNGFVAVGQLPRSQWINLLMFREYTWISHQLLIDDLNKFIGLIP